MAVKVILLTVQLLRVMVAAEQLQLQQALLLVALL
jgi:hypothetical protein